MPPLLALQALEEAAFACLFSFGWLVGLGLVWFGVLTLFGGETKPGGL